MQEIFTPYSLLLTPFINVTDWNATWYEERAVLTLNRDDFFGLHRLQPEPSSIIACKDDQNKERMATRIHKAISAEGTLRGKLI
ncbi:DUF5615 family PIN-like protein [Allocoleopsis sp.]|uniref:DUF5615 family PIN-like protein n=1 Tax=Allocoleopsis sp. TaxID=3088169 RepID=UPI002FD555F8